MKDLWLLAGMCLTLAPSPCDAQQTRHLMVCPNESRPLKSFQLPATKQLQMDPVKSRFVAAHRGETSRAHGNSRSAIVNGVKNSLAFLEVDIRMTKEQELFLFHDRRLLPNEVEVPEVLLGRDANEISSEELPLIHYADQGKEALLRFQELLQIIGDNSFTSLLLDLKYPHGAHEKLLVRVFEEVKKQGMLNRVVVQCQGLEELRLVRTKFPEFLVDARLEKLEEFEESLALKPWVIQGERDWFPPSVIAKIHRAGVGVLQKTLTPEFDHEQGWEKTIREGANVILSDRALDLQAWGCRQPSF